MATRNEEPARGISRAERIAERMVARVAEAARLATDYEQTLDPRQRTGLSHANDH